MSDFLTLDDVPVKGSRVLVRLDVNSPIEKGKVAGTDRLVAAAETVRALVAAGAGVVVLAHQGRKGDDDFTSLAEHAAHLGRFSGCPTRFVRDVAGPEALAAVDAVKPGEVVVLENVRSLEDETRKVPGPEHATAPFVTALASRVQVFVNEAFSASHRSQASLVGFPYLLPAVAGPQVRRELEALEHVSKEPERPAVAFLGGSKPEDSMALMRYRLAADLLDTVMLGGLVGELFLLARDNDLGSAKRAFLEKRGVLQQLPEAEGLLADFDDRILTPVDVGVKTSAGRRDVFIEELPTKDMILDVGEATIEAFGAVVASAGSVIVNGPAGLYEEPPFDVGTRGIFGAVRDSEAFSLLGGGHTVAALDRFGMKHAEFGYVSLAGGALLASLSGKKLPAVEALAESKRRFGV